MNRSERLEIRLTRDDKKTLQNLASEAGMTLSRYLVWRALKEEAYLASKHKTNLI